MVSLVHTPLDRLLDPLAQCLTVEVARQVAELRADPDVQAHVDKLAAKANEGTLSADERLEYEAYVEAIDIVSLLQAKAKRLLAVRGA